MKLRVSHLSRYEYAQTVAFSPHLLYLQPRETPFLRVSRFASNITPHAKVGQMPDALGNHALIAHFWDRADALSIRTEFEIETLETNPFDFLLRQGAAAFPFAYEPYERFVLSPYLPISAEGSAEACEAWLAKHVSIRPSETVALLSALNQRLYQTLQYARRDNAGVQSAAATLASGIGACRDYAVALADLCRTLGFAARFVSGYLYSEGDDHRTDNAMHAWTEVYLPGAGWKGIDPTHGIFCTEAYIPVAHAPVPECVSPVQGSYYSPVRVPSQLTTTVLVERFGG